MTPRYRDFDIPVHELDHTELGYAIDYLWQYRNMPAYRDRLLDCQRSRVYLAFDLGRIPDCRVDHSGQDWQSKVKFPATPIDKPVEPC